MLDRMKMIPVLSVLFLLAFGVAVPDQAAACPPNKYQASSGNCVLRPHYASSTPSGASAVCADGTYSHSEHPHASGTCSYHGGVRHYVGSGTGGSITARPTWRPFEHRPGDPTETPIVCAPQNRMTARDGCQPPSY